MGTKKQEREPLDDDLQIGKATIIIKRFTRVEKGVVIGSQVAKGHGIVMVPLGMVDFSKDTNFSPNDVLRSLGWEFVGDKAKRKPRAKKAAER
jgi:hypothetical protein